MFYFHFLFVFVSDRDWYNFWYLSEEYSNIQIITIVFNICQNLNFRFAEYPLSEKLRKFSGFLFPQPLLTPCVKIYSVKWIFFSVFLINFGKTNLNFFLAPSPRLFANFPKFSQFFYQILKTPLSLPSLWLY